MPFKRETHYMEERKPLMPSVFQGNFEDFKGTVPFTVKTRNIPTHFHNILIIKFKFVRPLFVVRESENVCRKINKQHQFGSFPASFQNISISPRATKTKISLSYQKPPNIYLLYNQNNTPRVILDIYGNQSEQSSSFI